MGCKPTSLLLKKFVNNRAASIGIGAMIVFIAMVLVAGIAASVLVQTSTMLEDQALKTGSQTTTEVASGITVEGIEGYNSSGSITKMAVEIKAHAGSPDIDLSETVVEISDSSNKYILTYDSGTFTDNGSIDGDIFSASFPSSATTNFGLIVLQDADDSCTSDTPIINFGDHIVIAIGDVFTGLEPRTDVFGAVIPEEGSPGIIGFRTPESFTDPILELQ
ncbi:MAG: flagellin [Candidatus Thermoplasmatota archaeon]